MSQIVDRRDIDFHIYEMLDYEKVLANGHFEAHDRASLDATFDTAEQIAEDKYLTCAAKLDVNEPEFDGEKVRIIPEVKEALRAYAEAGFVAMAIDEADGGFQLPALAVQVINGMFTAANVGIADYSLLTNAVSSVLTVHGTPEQKATYLPPILEGRWFGTMCLSEPHAGSSLSDIITKATPTGDGHYELSGTKMWISAGEHDLSENIINMVLARIPGGPPGTKGISMFLVPKYRVNADGSLGERNNIVLAGLNHKMGHRGTVNTVLNFGESGPCHGYLIGEPHKGLSYMFHMMNEARIGVGYSAAMSGLAGYLAALDYARNRPQGRIPGQKDLTQPQVPIIQHADIRRLLLAQKAAIEGALGLLTYCASLVDRARTTSGPEAERLNLLLEILTPIAKSWPSEFCLEANNQAIQVHGGYGYTKDFPVERHFRDNRLNMIHEGAHGIHGIDLLGRKVAMKNCAAFKELLDEIWTDLMEVSWCSEFADEVVDMNLAVQNLRDTTETALRCTDLEGRLANATLYLSALGHIVVAWRWLKQASVAQAALKTAYGSDIAFYRGKISACRYFFRYELPRIHNWLNLVSSLDRTCLDMSPEMFAGL